MPTTSPVKRTRIDATKIVGPISLSSDTYIQDWGHAVASGSVDGHSSVNKFGNALDFDTGDGEVTVWDGANDGLLGGGAMMYTFSSTADIDTISSSSGSDTVVVEVQGLDGDGNLVVQNVTLTGQTDATLSTPLWRVFRIKNVGASNLVGTVYLRTNGSAQSGGVPSVANTARAILQIGANQTEMAVYTVPLGKKAYINNLYASTSGASKATNYTVKMYIRPTGGVFQLKHRQSISDEKNMDKEWKQPETANALSDVYVTSQIEATGVTGGSTSAGFDLILEDV